VEGEKGGWSCSGKHPSLRAGERAASPLGDGGGGGGAPVEKERSARSRSPLFKKKREVINPMVEKMGTHLKGEGKTACFGKKGEEKFGIHGEGESPNVLKAEKGHPQKGRKKKHPSYLGGNRSMLVKKIRGSIWGKKKNHQIRLWKKVAGRFQKKNLPVRAGGPKGKPPLWRKKKGGSHGEAGGWYRPIS